MQFNFYHKTTQLVRSSLSKRPLQPGKKFFQFYPAKTMIHRHDCQANTSSHALENNNLHS